MSVTQFRLDRDKRYYIHRKIRKNGVVIDAHKRTLYITSENQVDSDVETLRDKYGYAVQFEIEQ